MRMKKDGTPDRRCFPRSQVEPPPLRESALWSLIERDEQLYQDAVRRTALYGPLRPEGAEIVPFPRRVRLDGDRA